MMKINKNVYMKQIVSLVLAVLCMGTASACAKKQAYYMPSFAKPLTILVMDTTQALLAEAEVKVGKTSYKTSYDGRIVLEPEQLGDAKSFSVSCEGYQAQKVKVADVRTCIVRLVPKPQKVKKESGIYYAVGSSKSAVRTDRAVVTMAAEAAVHEAAYDGVVHEAAAPSASNHAVAAGQLTAGEVNDFTKWRQWQQIAEDQENARWFAPWHMTPRERYTVQIMNREGFPIANYPVGLHDKKGNTVFLAMTDNTGKAELWKMDERLEVRVPEQTEIVDEPCDAPTDVDVMFVFDATGSMGDELHYLQAEMKDVIARASTATGGLTIRTGAVVYRDHGDEYLTRISRLTSNIRTTQAFIDKQQANGGGDFPEAVPEALMAALNSADWNENARARIAFLILDAPCHQDSATVALLQEQVLNAAAMGVRIVPVVCSGLDKAGEMLMRSIALLTNGTSFFLTDDSGIGNPHIQPTTDSLKVEHLNDMLVRTIVEFSTLPKCYDDELRELDNDDIEPDFVPNPFDAQELEADPTIPHGEGVHYLLDVSGKLLGIFEGEIKTDQLPIGVYFIKTFYNGQWFTQKILVH